MTASFPFAHVFTIELSLILLQFKINLNLSNDKSTPSSRWKIFKYCAIQYTWDWFGSLLLFFCLSMICCTPEILFVIFSSFSSSFSYSSFLLISSLSLTLLSPSLDCSISYIPLNTFFRVTVFCFLFLYCSFSLSPFFSFFFSLSSYSLTCPKLFTYSSPQILPLLFNFFLFHLLCFLQVFSVVFPIYLFLFFASTSCFIHFSFV